MSFAYLVSGNFTKFIKDRECVVNGKQVNTTLTGQLINLWINFVESLAFNYILHYRHWL